MIISSSLEKTFPVLLSYDHLLMEKYLVRDLSDLVSIRPLTKTSGSGVRYKRPRNVETQIEELVNLEKKEIVRRAMITDKQDAEYIRDESLVYLIREAYRDEDLDYFEQLFETVNRRILNIAEGSWTKSMPEQEREDVGGYVWVKFTEQVLDLESDKGEYAQIRFGDFIATHATAYRKSKFRKINEEIDYVRIDAPNLDTHDNDPQFQRISEEDLRILKNGIDHLRDEVKTVVWMVADGWKIESNDPTEPTICRCMNKTSRTIRNWIKEARDQLSDYRGIGG